MLLHLSSCFVICHRYILRSVFKAPVMGALNITSCRCLGCFEEQRKLLALGQLRTLSRHIVEPPTKYREGARAHKTYVSALESGAFVPITVIQLSCCCAPFCCMRDFYVFIPRFNDGIRDDMWYMTRPSALNRRACNQLSLSRQPKRCSISGLIFPGGDIYYVQTKDAGIPAFGSFREGGTYLHFGGHF